MCQAAIPLKNIRPRVRTIAVFPQKCCIETKAKGRAVRPYDPRDNAHARPQVDRFFTIVFPFYAQNQIHVPWANN